MNIFFALQGKVIEVFVDPERNISFRSDLTNNEFVGIDKLGNNDDVEGVELSKAIVKYLPEDIMKKYIIYEFTSKGLTYIEPN